MATIPPAQGSENNIADLPPQYGACSSLCYGFDLAWHATDRSLLGMGLARVWQKAQQNRADLPVFFYVSIRLLFCFVRRALS